MFLSTLRTFNAHFGIVAVLGYLGLFVMAFVLMFLFPLGALVLVFVGIFGLAIVVPAAAGAQALERSMNRRRLAAGSCPRCGATLDSTAAEGGVPQVCGGCGASWTPAGTQSTT